MTSEYMTDFMNYLKAAKYNLAQFKALYDVNIISIDDDMAKALANIDPNPVFEVGVVTGDVVYRKTNGAYEKAVLVLDGIEELNLGVANVERGFVVFAGLAYIPNDTFSIGDKLYLSSTAGEVSDTDSRVLLGTYISTNTILFNPVYEYGVRSKILYGDADSLSFTGAESKTIINYSDSNIASLNKSGGLLNTTVDGLYKINWFLDTYQSEDTNPHTISLIVRTLGSGGGVSTRVFYKKNMVITSEAFASGSIVFNLLADTLISLKLEVSDYSSGSIIYYINNITFELERV